MRNPIRLVGIAIAVLLLLVVGAPAYGPLLGMGPADPPGPGRLIDIGDGLRVNVIDEGKGPDLVLVHGLPGSGYDWHPLPEQLAAAGYRVVRYDRIGYGHSDRRSSDADHDFVSNARELVSLIEVLGLDRPTLVGWSYGGGVIQQAALDAPDRVGRLVLVGSVGPISRGHAEPRNVAEQILSSEWVLRWALASGFAARRQVAETSAIAFSPDPVPDWWPEHALSLMALSGTVHTWRMEETHYRPELLRPEELRGSVLILQGTADRLVRLATAKDLKSRIAGAQLAVVENGGHMLPNTHPGWMVEQIRAFLR
jgi:pimeloyl-ACP methyl ester carboxylesterase